MIIAKTDSWVVVDKPAGWLTIPGRHSAPVLMQWLKERVGPVWVVHRLDRETSGVVLFARTADAHRQANGWFQEHRVKKTYECLAHGIPSAPVLKINRLVEGVPSVSQVEVLESYQEGFLARVRPLTGRRHQIRIHLASEGHPLWGDVRYGGPAQVLLRGDPLSIPRVALHSARLELPSGEVFEAKRAEDFSLWLERLRMEGHCV